MSSGNNNFFSLNYSSVHKKDLKKIPDLRSKILVIISSETEGYRSSPNDSPLQK